MAVRDKSVQIIISAEVASALRAFDSAGKAIHRFSVETEKIGRAIDGVFSPLMRGLTTAVTAIGAGMGMLAKSALTVGGDFEITMKRVGGVTTATSEQFDEMTAKARKLGEELPISAQQAAEAMYSLSSAGMTAKETLEAIDAVTGLSIAQNYDLAQSANLMTATLRGFGLAASDSGRVADVFNNVIASSMLNMEKLGEAITYVSPVAKSLGISIEETAAAMGKLADSGLRGEQIGTALRAIMLQLLDPTAEAATELQRLGVTVTDTTGKLRPLDQIFTDLKASGMTAAEAVRIFDRRSVAAALTLSEVSGELKQYSEELGKLGRTQKLVADMMDTFKNKAEAVRSALKETLLVVFDQIQEQSKGVADELVKLVKVFNDWAKETQVFRKVIDALFEGFGLVTGNAELFAQALKSIDVDMIAGQFKSFAEGVKALFEWFYKLLKDIDWKGLISNLDKVATGIATGWAAGKMFLITAAVSGFANSILLLGKNIVSLASVVAANPIIGAMVATAAGVTSIIDSVDKLLQVEKDIAGYNAEAERMEKIARDYTEALEGNIVALGNLPKKYQDLANEQLKARIETEKFQKAFEGVTDAAMLATKAIFEAGLSSEEQVKQLSALWGDELADNFRRNGASAMAAFLSNFENMPADVRNVMVQVANSVFEGVEKVKDAVADVPKATETVAGSLRSAAAEIQEYFVTASQSVSELVNDGFLSAEQGADSLKEQIGAKAEEVGKNLAEKFKNPALKDAVVNAMREIGKQSGNALFVEVADTMQKVEDVTKKGVSANTGAIKKLMEEYKEFANGIGNVVAETESFIGVVLDNGVKEQLFLVDKATNTVIATGQNAANLMRISYGELLNWHRVMTDEVGAHVIEGFNEVDNGIAQSAMSAKLHAEFAMKEVGTLATTIQEEVGEVFESVMRIRNSGALVLVEEVNKGTGEIIKQSRMLMSSTEQAMRMVEEYGKKGFAAFSSVGVENLAIVESASKSAMDDAGKAIETGMIPPLEKTGETAKTTGAAIGALSAEAVKVADSFKSTIEGIDAAISKMGERMVSALSVAVEGLKTVFEQIGIDSGNSMMTALNRQVEAAIPSLSTTAANAGMSMGQSMGRSLESAMQTSLQNIARAVDAMARRAAAAVPAAAGSGGNVDAAALAAAYAREG